MTQINAAQRTRPDTSTGHASACTTNLAELPLNFAGLAPRQGFRELPGNIFPERNVELPIHVSLCTFLPWRRSRGPCTRHRITSHWNNSCQLFQGLLQPRVDTRGGRWLIRHCPHFPCHHLQPMHHDQNVLIVLIRDAADPLATIVAGVLPKGSSLSTAREHTDRRLTSGAGGKCRRH